MTLELRQGLNGQIPTLIIYELQEHQIIKLRYLDPATKERLTYPPKISSDILGTAGLSITLTEMDVAMAGWQAQFTSYGPSGPLSETVTYPSKEVAEEHARFLLGALSDDVFDYTGFTAYITPPPGEGKPYMYIDDRK